MEKDEEVKVEYHDNGTKMSETSYKKGVLNGVSSRWYKDGTKQSEHHYKDGDLHGDSIL